MILLITLILILMRYIAFETGIPHTMEHSFTYCVIYRPHVHVVNIAKIRISYGFP